VWKIPVRIQKFCNQDALVMPFVKPCMKTEDKHVIQAILNAIETFANAGFQHDDLR
jgi:hypothetical protein